MAGSTAKISRMTLIRIIAGWADEVTIAFAKSWTRRAFSRVAAAFLPNATTSEVWASITTCSQPDGRPEMAGTDHVHISKEHVTAFADDMAATGTELVRPVEAPSLALRAGLLATATRGEIESKLVKNHGNDDQIVRAPLSWTI
jgi:hypothetical protein